jgi:uncharacterized membrane protein
VRGSRIALVVVLVAACARFAERLASMPEMVASHFGGSGRPNAWMTKSTFACFSLIPFGVALIVGILSPLLVAKLPPSMVNLPNKEHWLAPERKEETLQRLGTRMEIFGVALVVFFAFVYELVFAANTSGEGLANGPFIVGMVLFLSFTIGWLVSFFRAFKLRN